MCTRRNAPALNRRILPTAALLLFAAVRSPAQPTIGFTSYAFPSWGGAPSITAGPNGGLWIADWDRISRMTTSGEVTTYLVPFAETNRISAYDIAAGPDGALWFTGSGVAKIGRITTAGVFTGYALPGSDHAPQRIATGSDGALWFTEVIGQQGRIGRITTSGAITEYELSPCPGSCGRYPAGIVAGPDGALWFTDLGDNRLHRITTSGAITDFGTLGLGLNVVPRSIAVGPDNALWFTAEDGNGPNDRIGRITTAGVITTYELPGFNHCTPNSIVAGSDGGLWFTCQRVNMIGRISTAGEVTPYFLPPAPSGDEFQWLRAITLGPDGALWIANQGAVIRAMIVSEQPDTSPPLITSHVFGTPGNNGWLRSAVTVSWSVIDPQSGIAASSGCATTTLTADTPGVTLTCSATNYAGLSNSVSVTVKIDGTPPVISGLPAPGCVLWPPNRELVPVADVRASDAPAGVAPGTFAVNATSNEPAQPGDSDIVVTPDPFGGFRIQLRADRLGSGNGRVYTLTASATDNAGNYATATSTCSVPRNR